MNILQIGCNNGSDDVFSFVKKNLPLIKKACFVDANPIALEQAKEKYKDIACCSFHNFAVVPIDIDGRPIKLYAPVVDEISGFSSVSRDHVVAHAHSEDLIEYEVNTISLENLLRTSSGDLAFLFIDTEGLDALNLLSVDFSRFHIENIVFEFIHTDGIVKTGPRLQSLLHYLSQFGYTFIRDPNCIYNIIASKK